VSLTDEGSFKMYLERKTRTVGGINRLGVLVQQSLDNLELEENLEPFPGLGREPRSFKGSCLGTAKFILDQVLILDIDDTVQKPSGSKHSSLTLFLKRKPSVLEKICLVSGFARPPVETESL
jgi:hypothetical protein